MKVAIYARVSAADQTTENQILKTMELTNVAVSAGDRINFIVDPRVYGNFDSTGFTATISVVPLPATVFLLGSGLVGLAGVRRKYKK